MRYELFISLRYLFSGKKRFVSFMSLISILGVAVGVACLITVLAVMNGFGYELQKRMVGSNPHIIIEKENGISPDEYSDVTKKINQIKDIKGSFGFVWGQSVLKYRSRARGVEIRSAALDNSIDYAHLAEKLVSGSLRGLGDDGVIIGSELSSALGAFVGDEIGIVTPATNKINTFKVKGIFSSGMYEYDLNMAYIELKTCQQLFGMKDSLGGIGLYVHRIENTEAVKERLVKELDPFYYIRTWQDMNRNLFSAIRLEKWTMFVILTLIVIVAALNIVSTLTVMVTEKRKDIGILKAIGATRAGIMGIFSLQGFMIGVIGVIFGVSGGLGLSFLLKKYHFISLPKDIYYISEVPVRINIMDSLAIVISALIISFLASIYPAYQAARLDPVSALRYE